MGLFRYEAVDGTGKVFHGAMNANDQAQVVQNLTRMGYTARTIIPATPNAVAPARQPVGAVARASSPVGSPMGSGKGIGSVTLASGVPVSIKSCVNASELARFFRHVATLVKSGISINEALNDISGVVHNPILRKVLPRMQENTSGGNSLSGLMAQYPGVFPVHTIASIYAGELAGKLEIALDEVASCLEQEVSDARLGRIGWGLTKINLLCLALALPAASFTDLLLPTLKQSLNHTMNNTEVIGFVIRTFVHDMLWKSLLMMAAMVASWMVWGVLKRVPTVRRLIDGIIIHVPLWGALHRERALARFLHVLDGLYASGISPGTAWDAASLVPNNSYVAEKLRTARSNVSAGAGLSEMLAAAGLLESGEVGLVAGGEKAGQVPEVLSRMAINYESCAAARKVQCRAVATSIMTVFALVLSAVVLIQMVSSYGELATKAAEMMSQ